MGTLIQHLIKLTDHRERDLLELTMSKALIDLLPLQRVVIARVVSEEGSNRWLQVARLDAKGGGMVADPLHVDFSSLPKLEDEKDRLRCIQTRSRVEVALQGDAGPRISYAPLFESSRTDDDGVLEIHAPKGLTEAEQGTVDVLLHVYRNMYHLLAYSDRDGLTGLFNRKSLDDTFYSAVLEELDEGAGSSAYAPLDSKPVVGQERRHRVPPNYWLGTVSVDHFNAIGEKSGHLIAEEVLLLVARILNNTFRTYDRIYRLGGEQFAVLMHCPDEGLVLAAFERFRTNMDKFNFPQAGHITACGGFTRITADDSPSTALERAERAVDYGQHQGGNQVASYGELVRKGLLGDLVNVGDVDLF
ncbi:GGDEF domain-containing protein [Rhodoferax lacus]|uniref:diguanylate cyclase n=2 Tax=Rhodoferax lacus TaxID=2184758 RepID=A0A3E1RA09_9BURK|nr:GGDEF domain-containing protein [Rhodoferax lacus]